MIASYIAIYTQLAKQNKAKQKKDIYFFFAKNINWRENG